MRDIEVEREKVFPDAGAAVVSDAFIWTAPGGRVSPGVDRAAYVDEDVRERETKRRIRRSLSLNLKRYT